MNTNTVLILLVISLMATTIWFLWELSRCDETGDFGWGLRLSANALLINIIAFVVISPK